MSYQKLYQENLFLLALRYLSVVYGSYLNYKMDFQKKIRELDFIHARLRAERLALEQREKHDKAMQVAISEVKQN